MASQQDQIVVPAQIFPESIQVLVIDANLVSLKIHRALLEKCKYKVITITDANFALHLLRQPENKIDLVLSHVVRHGDMDGLELLETISAEMDIPVVLVSASDDMDHVVRALRHGASDYLTKPVQLGDIKKLWYHVFKKTRETPGKLCISKDITVKQEETPSGKRVRCEDQKTEECETSNILNNRPYSSQSRRVSWTPDLHSKFLDAINKLLGTKPKIYPLDILEQMNVPGLTRQHVASHLQKFRRNLIKSRAENRKSEHVLAENNSTPKTSERIHQLQHIICQGQTVHDQRKQNLMSASTFNLLNNPIVQQGSRHQDFGYYANPSRLSFQQISDSQSYFPSYSYPSSNFSSDTHLIKAAAASPQVDAFSQHALPTMPPLQDLPLSGQHGGQHAIDFVQQPENFVQSAEGSNMRENLIDYINDMQVPEAPTYVSGNDQKQFNQETFSSNGGGLFSQNSFSLDSDLNELNGSVLRQNNFSELDFNEMLKQFL